MYSVAKTISSVLRHHAKTSVRPRRVLRKMRGGTQSHLIEATDGEFYVLKSVNNPQHRRILVNEWLCAAFLRHLGIFAPHTTLIEITPEFAARQSELYVLLGSRRETVPPGIHLGSHVAVNPNQTAIFDFLPDKTLAKVENRQDFLGVLVFDKWVSQADSRQSVFFRARRREYAGLSSSHSAAIKFWAQMIDHGFAFNGSLWQFHDSPLQGHYFRPSVYDAVHSIDSFGPWLEGVNSFPTEFVETVRKQIPRPWIQDDEVELERMLERLLLRRSRVPALIYDMHRSRPGIFPNWSPVFSYQCSNSGIG